MPHDYLGGYPETHLKILTRDPAFAHPLYWSGFVLINSWL
jgi:CHAT domain-containing protein